MARERMITRTIVTNMFSVIAVNLDAMSVETLHVPAPVDVDTCEKADKFFRKSWSISGYINKGDFCTLFFNGQFQIALNE